MYCMFPNIYLSNCISDLMCKCISCVITTDFLLPPLCPGVTAIRPDELEFPNTMTDIDYDTWMLR